MYYVYVCIIIMSFFSDKSKDSLKKFGLGATKRSEKQNGGGEEEIRAVDHGKAPMTATSENDNNNRETTTRSEALPLPPNSGKIITPKLKAFTLSELKKATRDFRPDTVLGEGGFGRVFKGWIDEKTYAPSRVGVGMAVAVKKSNPDSSQGLSEWQVILVYYYYFFKLWKKNIYIYICFPFLFILNRRNYIVSF